MYKKLLLFISILVLAVIYFSSCQNIAFSQDLNELEVDHALTFDVITPHINWARPSARGQVHALFFISGLGTSFREGVELMQRFDIAAEGVLYSRIIETTRDDWHGGHEGITRMDALLKKDWDVYVFLGISPAKMTEELRKKVVEKVYAGAGVVLSGIDEPVLLPDKAKITEAIPFLFGIDGTRVFNLGKGRGVRMPARPVIDYTEGWQNAYESWQANLGRALIWASRKEPAKQLSLELSKTLFDRMEPVLLRVRLSDTLLAKCSWLLEHGQIDEKRIESFKKIDNAKPTLQLWIRKPVGWVAPWPDRELVSGNLLELTIPRLPSGRYHLDGRVVTSSGVESWASIPFEVSSQRRIDRITLNPDWSEPGGKMSGTVFLAGKSLPAEKVCINILDKNRRILMGQELKTGSEQVNFSFNIPTWLPMLVTVEASIIDKNEVLSSSFRYFHITERNRNRFNFLMWDVPRGTLAPYAEENLARTGVTLQLAQGNPLLNVAANDISWVPYTTYISAKLDTNGIMKPFCWNDRPAVDANLKKLTSYYQASRQHGVFAYSLGDEIATQGACLAQTCLDTYRDYIKNIYGTLDALNRSWGTNFADWERVGLSKMDDNDEAQAFKDKNYPRWFDRQAFKSLNFVQYAKKYAESYSGIDPLAKTGFEGAGRFTGGDDIDMIVRNLDFWSPYPGTTDEVIRSISARDFPRSNWMGYTKDADSLLQKYWRMLTRGMDSVWWWRWDCIGKFHGWLAPDLRPYPAVKEILKDTQPVREGLGDLLLKSRIRDDGIAILYSYPSTFAHKLDEGASFEEYEKSHIAWHKAIRDLGLQFSYVTDRMMRLGEFNAKRFRVLVLPRAEAIGDKEARVIRQFVTEGGVVIADTRPGIYDDHCKKRESGVLDDLFGIRRLGYLKAKSVLIGDKKISSIIDPGIAVKDGFVIADIGGSPSLIVKKMGKGYALLINGDLNALQAMLLGNISKFPIKETTKSKSVSEYADDSQLELILERLAGIRAKIELKRDNNSPMRDVEVIQWENGKNEIIALFRQGGKKEAIAVKLSRNGYVYDLRNRKSLGYVKEFKTEIIPNRASFFAVLPEPGPVAKVEMKSVLKQGQLANVRLSIPGAKGDHALLVTAKFPKPSAEPPRSGAFFPRTGYPVMPITKTTVTPPPEESDTFEYPGIDPEKGEFFKKVVIVGRATTAVDIPIAFNDPLGNYEISVKELFTNKTIKSKLTIH